jgi:hypothetical protein
MKLPDSCNLPADLNAPDLRQHDSPVVSTLPVTNDDLASLELHVLHSQLQPLHQSQSGAIEQGSHQQIGTIQLVENRQDFGAGQHDWKPARLLRPDHVR